VDLEGMAAEEAGRIMGLAPGTIRSHVHHARRQLREALGEYAGMTETEGGRKDEK
jgi:DNA-directed RNA polymerase specialized sigma24 family protein